MTLTMLNLPCKRLNEQICKVLAPMWLSRASTTSGLFLPGLDRNWQRTGAPEATVVSQSRLRYVFAEAYRLTRNEQYLDAVRKGTECLLRDFWPMPRTPRQRRSTPPERRIGNDRTGARKVLRQQRRTEASAAKRLQRRCLIPQPEPRHAPG